MINLPKKRFQLAHCDNTWASLSPDNIIYHGKRWTYCNIVVFYILWARMECKTIIYKFFFDCLNESPTQ